MDWIKPLLMIFAGPVLFTFAIVSCAESDFGRSNAICVDKESNVVKEYRTRAVKVEQIVRLPDGRYVAARCGFVG